MMKSFDYAAMGNRMRHMRITRKLTQEQMAEVVNISPSFYGNLERGSRIPSLETMLRISDALSVSPNYLLRGAEESDETDAALFERLSVIVAILQKRIK